MKCEFAKVSLSLLASVATPAIIFWVIEFIDQHQYFHGKDIHYAYQAAFTTFSITFIIALVHAIILGIPVYLIAKKFNLLKWWMSLVGGFFIGGLPIGIWSFPIYSTTNFSSMENGKTFVKNGVATADGWINYFEGFLGMSLIGMVCGFSAWLVWRSLSSKDIASKECYR